METESCALSKRRRGNTGTRRNTDTRKRSLVSNNAGFVKYYYRVM